ncbi:hypothetical protein [Luteimonas salinilitoris]|uniref:Haem-binding uptake Tiki superfamily ChaN domain-containing protein n=1 Tax=Luteimonas salinilitoris TaxID=3237697 RepID=A0ABV4HTX7_9GAMM
MRQSRLFALFLILAPMLCAVAWAATPGPDSPARVVILGVDHAVQLVSKEDQPGMLAAFIERVAPDAICIERPPEQYARDDHYEFTYEIQDVALPYAREHGIEVCPFDWIPSQEDQMLGWSLDLSVPPEVRAPDGFQGFLSFPEPHRLRRTLFAADDPATLGDAHAWVRGWPERMSRDLPRRMFLYRTFMQARRIAAAAKARPGRTVLVVVGELHKHDIEAILADEPAVEIMQPSRYGAPAAEAVARLTTRAHRIAIASFNILGRQASTGNVDWDWVGNVLDALEAERRDAETDLLRTRHDVLTGRIDAAAAIARYRRIAADPAARRGATWDGVLDRGRVDSYFDPFGNLRIDQRARVELARELRRLGETEEVAGLLAALRRELTPRKARQLEAYWQREAAPG